MKRLSWFLEFCGIFLLVCLYAALDGVSGALRRFQVWLQIRRFRRKFR